MIDAAKVAELERRLERIEAHRGGVVVSDANISAAPTDAELDAIFGNASDLYEGFVGVVDDAGGATAVYLCIVKSNKWWYESLTAAV